MNEKCHNHPDREALSLCHSCGSYYCADCLTEGIEYYYCQLEPCQLTLQKEIQNKPARQQKTFSLYQDNKKLWQLIVAISLILPLLIQVFFPRPASDIPQNKLEQFSNEIRVEDPNVVESLFGVAGAALGLLLIPFIPAGIVAGIFRLLNKSLSSKHFMNIYTVCWIVIALMSTAGNLGAAIL